MLKSRVLSYFLFLSAAVCLALPTQATAEIKALTVIRAGRMFDATKGVMLADQLLVVEGRRIKEVLPQSEMPEGGWPDATWIDLSNAVVLPGLIDCHTHLTLNEKELSPVEALRTSAAQIAYKALPHARKTLEAGFTSVRDLGSYRAFVDLALRDAIERGDVVGPRVFGTGTYLTIQGGGGSITGITPDIELPRELRFGVVTGPDAIRKRVREIVAQGADWIKVIASGAVLSHGNHTSALEFTEEEIRAAVLEAKQHGRRVAAHAHATEAIKNAIRAGVTSVEHGSLLDDEAIALMQEHGTYLVSDIYNDEFLSAANSHEFIDDAFVAKENSIGQLQRESFQRAAEAKVKIAYGTDAGVYPHGDNGKQFAFMVKYGLTPAEALQSATTWAADLLGQSANLGSLTPGKLADVIAVPRDPLVDMSTMEEVRFVMKDGKLFKSL